jgi:poly(hydroxyalkanoate) granule-associated protein
MVKKLKELAQAGGESQMAERIKASASQIWLAGLGAFSTAQREGTKIFDSLVEEGKSMQAQTMKAAGAAIGDLKANVSKSLEQVSWSQLESVFEERVARALHALNVPTKKDLDLLSKRVAELTAVTEKLSGKLSEKSRPAAKRPAKSASAAKAG